MYNFLICSVNISNAKPHEYSVKHEFNVFYVLHAFISFLPLRIVLNVKNSRNVIDLNVKNNEPINVLPCAAFNQQTFIPTDVFFLNIDGFQTNSDDA